VENELDEQLAGIAALDHPTSRRVYHLVREQGWVSRDGAANALGLARHVAAFHLDKLVDAGLLDARYERTSGRSGPGAGRPAKMYGPSSREIDVSLPPRRYDLAGSVLAEAITRAAAEGKPVGVAVSTVARTTGERVGAQAAGGAERSGESALMDLLTAHGYEPQRKGREIALLNCPFHRLSQEHRDLVCGMNRDFLTGVLQGAGAASCRARLAPEPGYCCVRIDPE
jgi:predicted ArsR family transcriptional regulator